ncbi:MalY/PatB family protein [Spiroplasma alleghenense]|uniref:cysteine-S-conjugate beta-lyase n=1 Tax=Spiroplasma alleghenense TaxID=216931 RepID=A0A345Z5A2_9MOLU|nr:aminotransferase class I/II-fold pyridoxal phosphate-dependent enzyme [Spiroplasma alleghenense]AXK51781.1 cystathione beta-lyase [Spiroplasma alleghenense]
MKYNFDSKINRQENKERKNDLNYLKDNYQLDDVSQVINSSIADLDFQTPDDIRKAIIHRANQSTYSYTFVQKEFNKAIQDWYQKLHNIKISQHWIKSGHGTVNALFQIVQAFTNKGENVLIQTPIYGPFFRAINLSERNVIENKLVFKNQTYEIDFKDFENKIIENNVKLFLFCNPHNPGGVVWSQEQVQEIIRICQKHKVLIVSDEVHGDLVLNDLTHQSLLKYKVTNNNFIICNSPNKAFNLGGLKGSYLIIADEEIKRRLDQQFEKNSTTSPNIFFQPALISAYNSVQVFKWLKELKEYVYENYLFLKKELSVLENVEVMKMQASYLVWIKYDSNLLSFETFNKLLKENNLIVGMGAEFGSGNDWFRINIGLSRQKLQELTNRLVNILKIKKEK